MRLELTWSTFSFFSFTYLVLVAWSVYLSLHHSPMSIFKLRAFINGCGSEDLSLELMLSFRSVKQDFICTLPDSLEPFQMEKCTCLQNKKEYYSVWAHSAPHQQPFPQPDQYQLRNSFKSMDQMSKTKQCIASCKSTYKLIFFSIRLICLGLNSSFLQLINISGSSLCPLSTWEPMVKASLVWNLRYPEFRQLI